MALEWLGRIEDPDPRDQDFPMRAVVPERTERTWRYWWPSGHWGDQGPTPRCVEYAWWHQVMDGPMTAQMRKKRNIPWSTPQLYCAAQRRDPWEGDCDLHLYDGTSVRAGAKVLRDAKIIEEYRWAQSIDDVVQCLLEVGPVVAGTIWTDGMMRPAPGSGKIAPTGNHVGGHAYVLNGINVNSGYIRIKNSWGRNWGHNGYAYLKIADFAMLLSDRGEAALSMERKLTWPT